MKTRTLAWASLLESCLIACLVGTLSLTSLGCDSSSTTPAPTPDAVDGDADDLGGGGEVDAMDPEDGGDDTGASTCQTNADCEGLVETNACEIAICDTATGTCVTGAKKDYAPCSGDDPCFTESYCLGGTCNAGPQTDCDDGNPCTDDDCASDAGCQNVPNTDACEDGNACTAGDTCTDGLCLGTPEPGCGCEADADCAQFDDGNACNGVIACIDGQCTTDIATIVVCDTSGDGPCTETLCDGDTGACVATPLSGNPCSDGNACTAGDTCADGVCVSGDTNACACSADADCADYENDDLCDGTLACIDGVCAVAPDTVVTCEDTGNPCTVAVCEPSTGVCADQSAPSGTPCASDDLCAPVGLCQFGSCEGEPKNCSDGNPCTADSCDPETGGCSSAPDDGAACDDGDPCTVSDACAEGVCGGSTKPCDDLDPCTVDSCDAETGDCVSTPGDTGEPCDDGIGCTEEDTCQGDGACAGTLKTCDDGDPCTLDSCDNETGECVAAPASDALCDDGDACTEGDTCVEGSCEGAAVSCDDDNVCTADTCDAVVGCVNAPVDGGCDDGDACTEGDACVGGACAATPVDCDDGNVCTDDSCDADTGACLNAFNTSPCDDDDLCTNGDQCVEGVCLGTEIPACEAFCGDGVCSNGEACEDCPEDCGVCPDKGGCCDANGSPGCNDAAIEACVCEIDDFCCALEWDEFCVTNGQASCGLSCSVICGDGTCGEAEDCELCPADCGACPAEGSCCEAHATPGCEDSEIQSCVCNQDGYCCDVEWDEACVGLASECDPEGDCPEPFCGDGFCGVAEDCGSCAEDCGACPGDGPCCEANETPGCEDPDVTTCVCEVDGFCCAEAWDPLCVEAAVACGGCSGCGDGVCDGEAGEGCDTCPADCNDLCAPDTCGDSACGPGEDCVNCAADCGECPDTCGDGVCDGEVGEDWSNCSADCPFPFDGDCCEPNGSPGCDDVATTECVCDLDSFCCDFGWDGYCVGLGVDFCGLEGCGPLKGDCCDANEDGAAGCSDLDCEALVCDIDGFCCTNEWDASCAAAAAEVCELDCGPVGCGDGVCDAEGGEDCETCEEDCGPCVYEGDCCTANGSGGCEDADTSACVCGFDSFCCDTTWDELCVTDIAIALCGLECPVCGDGVCEGAEDCASCAGDCGSCGFEGSCCEANDSPGCDDADVVDCLCAVDPFCCEADWDGICVQQAIGSCGLNCDPCGDGVCDGEGGEDCETCADDCGACSKGDCCADTGTPGCDTAECEEVVCEVDPFCCDTVWESICALEAAELCGDLCAAGSCGDSTCDASIGETCETCAVDCGACPACGDGECTGEEACGSCVEDCGWCTAEQSCCEPAVDEAPGCEDFACTQAVCDGDSLCCEIGWDAFCVEAALVLCPTVCGDTCGDGVCEAGDGEDCETCPGDCGACPAVCGDAVCDGDSGEDCVTCADDCGDCAFDGDCCEANGTPGCDDQAVVECLCALDDFCCATSYDSVCLAEAVEFCGLECGEACGDEVCDAEGGETCENCETDCGPCGPQYEGACCEENGSPGCEDDAITACICEQDSYCCEAVWDSSCIVGAEIACGLDCTPEACGDGVCDGEGGEDCATCPADCGACDPCGDGVCDGEGGEDCATCVDDCGACPSNCCESNGVIGCDDPTCQGAVCGVDPFCCDSGWDEVCADAAVGLCPDLCGDGDACGDGVCDGEGGEDCATCEADCGACPVCGDGVCAGEGGEDCATCEADCGECPAPSDCCTTASAAGGCVDVACEAVVCVLDPGCCSVGWDATCVAMANTVCELCSTAPVCGDAACDGEAGEDCETCPEDCGACPEPSDCCTTETEAGGCADPVCEAAVCAEDSFCCDDGWDSICNDIAAVVCPDLCGSAEPCGDGTCDGEGGEDCETCPDDCGACPACPDSLFISEYVEGSSFTKAIELYNPTGEDVDLSAYAVWKIANGGDWATEGASNEVALSGTLAAGDVYVICDDGADPAVLAECDLQVANNPTNFNGDDAVGLVKDGVLIDVVGDEGGDPGDGWDVGGVTEATKNHTLVRVPTVLEGTTDWAASAVDQWSVLDIDDVSNIGFHVVVDAPCDGGAGPVNDCCSESTDGTAGCNDEACESFICETDALCCSDVWDDVCAEAALIGCEVCGGLPSCGDGVCDDAAGEDCGTCAFDCGACPVCGDGTCALTPDENCSTCEADCGVCTPNDCCVESPQSSPGCAETECAEAVCADDDFCCTVTWDALCAAEAATVCVACGAPGCGDGFCDDAAGEDCSTCEADCGACAAFCGDLTCDADEDCETCSVDCGACPVCGDGVCEPGENCADCEADCGACPSNCCTAGGDGAGCDNAYCQADVCEADSVCCEFTWDGACAQIALEVCDVCNYGTCCGPHDGAGCTDATCEAQVCETNAFCCDSLWDDLCAVAAQATCDVCAAELAVCGDGTCDPTAAETCATCPDDCGACCGDGFCSDSETCLTCPTDCGGCGADCCSESGDDPVTTGCMDPDCQTAVCDEDPFCCDTIWDGTCAATANSVCDVCTLPQDCCTEHFGLGCGDAECEATVCADDASCCDTMWDAECAAAANASCETCGGNPYDGDCCANNATPGCDNLACTQGVCTLDSFCCSTEWGDSCVALAALFCPTVCL